MIRRTLDFYTQKDREPGTELALVPGSRRFSQLHLAPVVVAITIVIPVFILVFAVANVMPVAVIAMAVVVSVAVPRYLPAVVPAVIAIMVIAHGALISGEATVVAVSVAAAVIVAVTETRFVGPPPLPVFLLPLTVQAVVLDVAVAPLGQPLAIGVIVVGAAVIGASVIRTGAVPALRATGKSQRSQNESCNKNWLHSAHAGSSSKTPSNCCL